MLIIKNPLKLEHIISNSQCLLILEFLFDLGVIYTNS